MSTSKTKSKKGQTARKAPAKAKASVASKAASPEKAGARSRASTARKAGSVRKEPPKAASTKPASTGRKAASGRKPASQPEMRRTAANAKAPAAKSANAAKAATRKVTSKKAPAKVSASKPAPQHAPAKAAPVSKSARKPATVPAEAAKPSSASSTKARPAVQNGVETSMPVKKPTTRPEFRPGEHIVYPAHGVGRIVGIDTQEVAGIRLDLFVISFIKDKMTLRVPVPKATAVGMRKLADASTVKKALETVRGRARIKRTMWSRRAQEYEAKINSGDLIAIAEVVRDLYRSENQPEQSYSERQLYEAALDRMAREIASVNHISETEAIRQIEQNLAKSPRRGAKPDIVETQDKAA